MEQMLEMQKLQKKFHKFWKKYGEPHPSSNAYIALNRAFYYSEGVDAGISINTRSKLWLKHLKMSQKNTI